MGRAVVLLHRGLAARTRRTYRLLLDHQILPHLGGAPLASIDPLAVHEWQAGLVAAGLSPSRIRNAAQVLGQILDAAVAGGRLHRNPAQGLRRPRIIEARDDLPDRR
jgi:site-specific recombinase XerC